VTRYDLSASTLPDIFVFRHPDLPGFANLEGLDADNTPFGGTILQTFPEATGAFDVCIPANVSPGPITVEALQLTDAWCSCN